MTGCSRGVHTFHDVWCHAKMVIPLAIREAELDWKCPGYTASRKLAERVGIEPTVPLPGQQFSRLPDSATLAPLRVVDLTDGRRTYGVDLSLLRSIVRQLTLGSVIFQLVFFDAAQNRRDCVETHMIS
jgi:hypothetical protein